MSILSGKSEIVTQEMVDAGRQLRQSNWLLCAFCGHHFSVGQTVRFVISPVPFFHNFFVCTACDDANENLFVRAEALVEEYYRRFAWKLDDDESLRYHWEHGKIVRPYYQNPRAQ